MRAIALEGSGGAEALVRRALPQPRPATGEILVRVINAGISQADCRARAGEAVVHPAQHFPWIPGFEVAGVVDGLGPATRRFRIGDRVWALAPRGGGYAQYIAVDESLAAPMPAGLLFEEAATLALDGLAALAVAQTEATLLVLGAASGAGHLAVQLGLAAGLRVVAVAGGAQRAFLDKLGALEYLESEDHAAEWLREESATGRAVRVVVAARQTILEPAPGQPRFIDLGGGPGSLQASILRSGIPPGAAQALNAWVDRKRLRPRLFKIFDVADAAVAHTLEESGTACGKLALSF